MESLRCRASDFEWPASLESAISMSCIYVLDILLCSLSFAMGTIQADMLNLLKEFEISSTNHFIALWLRTSGEVNQAGAR